ncbi:thioesterase family protein [soil metagenome]
MLGQPDAFYEADGGLFRPSELTRGPWDEGSQHAGPVAALIAGELERVPTPDDAGMRLGRITYEILRPVPIAPLRIGTWVERDGRRIQMLGASLHSGDDEVIRARAWRLRTNEVEIPGDLAPDPPSHRPADGEERDFFATGAEVGYHTAVEYRFVDGAWLEPGPATVWMRARVPVVAGRDVSPLQRVMVVADSGNGVSATLDWRRFLFINVDLTVNLHRYPAGEWVCLDATTVPERDGIGLADALLMDERGPIGRAAQTLLVAER